MITYEVYEYYDTNMDGYINPEDDLDGEHYGLLVEYCDFNNDGTLAPCEIHTCVVLCENEWRDENCPEYGYVYCECPIHTPECAGEMNCIDVINTTEEVMMYLDTNGDGQINLGDDIGVDHLDMLVEYCDTDYNGVLCAYEI
jgi:hypothetical protein